MAPTAPGVLSASLTNLSERLVDMLSKASSTARGFHGVYGLVHNTPGSTSSNLARTS